MYHSRGSLRPSPPPRPAALFVFGLFNLLVGSVQLLYHGGTSLCCLGSFAFLEFLGNMQGWGMLGQDQKDLLESFIPGFTVYLVSSLMIWSALGVLLFVAGIGLMGAKEWARKASLIWAASTIVLSIASLIYVAAVVGPGWIQMEKEQQKLQQAQGPFNGKQRAQEDAPNLPLVAAVFTNGIGILYAALLGLFMLMPSVRQACQAQAKPGDSNIKAKSFFEEDGP